MKSTRKKISLLLSAACLSAFALISCTTESEDSPAPTGVDSLHVQGSVLRALGDTVFLNNCSGCHGAAGEGGHGPVLANSDWLMNYRQKSINLILRGNNPVFIDTLVVNGMAVIGGGMPAWHASLSNKDIAAVLTYLRGVLNDSTVVSCTGGGSNVCTKVARTPAAMTADTVAVWEVKAVRDSLTAAQLLTF